MCWFSGCNIFDTNIHKNLWILSMMRFDISHDINGRKIMDVYLWGMFLPGKINITIYLWKVRIDGWKLGSPPSVPFASFENFQLSGYIYIYSSCVANTASARIKSRRIYKRQKASLPLSPSASSFRLLRKPQSKLAHRELRRFFLKSFPRSSTKSGKGRVTDWSTSSFTITSSSFLLPARRKNIVSLDLNTKSRSYPFHKENYRTKSYGIKNTRANENKRDTSRRR